MKSKSAKNTVPDDLPPRTRQMLDALAPPKTDLNLDDDTQARVDAMHKKHE